MTAEEEKPGTQGGEAREALERFVIENDDLLDLESRIGRFNIFDALGVARAEIRHSNFLAFLLDPSESHGQGQLFLKTVLMDLLRQASPERRPLSPIELDGTDLRDVEVKREWKHTDLLITCQQPRFAVVIENKIGSKEGPDQLSRYKAAVEKHYPGALYVYLTLKADEPSEDAWVPYGYEDIHRVLRRVRKAHRKAIGDEVLVFLDHYLNLIGTRFMNDTELDELCRKIYKKHRQALDLIWERVGNPESGVIAKVANVLEDDPRWGVVARPSNSLHFVPKAWLEWLPPLALRVDSRSWIYASLFDPGDRLLCAVHMAPMSDPTKRIEIATKLLDECTGFGFKHPKSKQVKNNYSRVSAVETILQWDEHDEPESDGIRAAVKKTLDDLYPKLEKLASVLKPLCQFTASPR
jgi:hypothetical protein